MLNDRQGRCGLPRHCHGSGHFPPIRGREYFIGQAEKLTEQRQDLLKVAKEAIDGSAR